METFSVQTHRHTEFVTLDREVQQLVDASGVQEGVVHIYIPHTTAGVTINENADPDVKADMELILDRVVPWEGGYAHMEGNSASHVKASMMGFSATVLIDGGRIQLGTWQSVYFAEFDGPRTRKVWVQILGA